MLNWFHSKIIKCRTRDLVTSKAWKTASFNFLMGISIPNRMQTSAEVMSAVSPGDSLSEHLILYYQKNLITSQLDMSRHYYIKRFV
jgi:hypothetical protein